MNYELKHNTKKNLSFGKYYPLGSTLANNGVNFAIYSQYAREVYLLLFDKDKNDPTDIIKIENRTKFIWHIFIQDIPPGQLYGYKIKGDYAPDLGLRFNQNKLLIDPYAKAITKKFENVDNLLLSYNPNTNLKDLSFDTNANDHIAPKSIVIDDYFDWQDDSPPDIPLEKLYIYEVHIKGFTAHKSSKIKHPGTYLGFIEKIPYLKDLGINAVEFLPIQEFYIEDFLKEKGLTNYWGYNTINFFSPELSYSTQNYPGCQVNEFKTLVRELHKAGIEVIMDVVYNHTGEGNHLGPTISFKGIDNLTYYILTGSFEKPLRYYKNFTGCGNTLNFSNPQVIKLVMDSLRYWVKKMHVDGFRFDLASVLGRKEGLFQKSSSFFDTISQDPILSKIKLIAEPWDVETYEVGNFPIDWSEWNGKFRDTMRKFGKSDNGQINDLSKRITGSNDLYGDDGRSPYNSINFITCHDGFTLNDLVSYNYKHNENNLENNSDGTDNNNSWNSGFEGETQDQYVISLRKQLIKNHICYLLLSCGTPMILGGDEFSRTQKGNNNAYCQDNEISWFDWNYAKKNTDIFVFFKKCILFTKECSILQRRKFFSGKDTNNNNFSDITWYGKNLDKPDWNNNESKILCYLLDGSELKSKVGVYYLFIILNSGNNLEFVKIPSLEQNKKWFRVIDTSLKSGEDILSLNEVIKLIPIDYYIVNPRSTVVLIGK